MVDSNATWQANYPRRLPSSDGLFGNSAVKELQTVLAKQSCREGLQEVCLVSSVCECGTVSETLTNGNFEMLRDLYAC